MLEPASPRRLSRMAFSRAFSPVRIATYAKTSSGGRSISMADAIMAAHHTPESQRATQAPSQCPSVVLLQEGSPRPRRAPTRDAQVVNDHDDGSEQAGNFTTHAAEIVAHFSGIRRTRAAVSASIRQTVRSSTTWAFEPVSVVVSDEATQASRTKFALSIPLVLGMGSATHDLPFQGPLLRCAAELDFVNLAASIRPRSAGHNCPG